MWLSLLLFLNSLFLLVSTQHWKKIHFPSVTLELLLYLTQYISIMHAFSQNWEAGVPCNKAVWSWDEAEVSSLPGLYPFFYCVFIVLNGFYFLSYWVFLFFYFFPGWSVKVRDVVINTNFLLTLFVKQIEYPEIEDLAKPRHRFMSSYEQVDLLSTGFFAENLHMLCQFISLLCTALK